MLIAGVTIYLIVLYQANYSTGFRAGIPAKLSKRGVLFKTWEGQLVTGVLQENAGGGINNTWDFSILNSADSVQIKIEEAIAFDKRVKLYYNEKYRVLFWRGDTPYFVYKVEILD